MDKRINVYVPVKVGKVQCHSTMLDEIGAFTQFVIWSIGNGYPESQIKATVQLDELVVDEALEALERWKFAEPEYEDKWKLTSTGREYFELIRCMEKLGSEDNGFPCCVEMYEGKLELISPDQIKTLRRSELPDNALQLPKKATEVFLHNDNYGDSLELVKAVLREKRLLDDQYMGSLYTTLNLEKEIRYRVYKTPPYDLAAPVKEEKNACVQFAVPIAQFQYKKYAVALDEYRTVLETMENLQVFEEQRCLAGGTILSENARKILEAYKSEKACAPINIYVDEHIGEMIWRTIPENIVLQDRAKATHLLSTVNVHPQYHEGGDWRYEESKTDRAHACPVKFQFSELCPAERESTDE